MVHYRRDWFNGSCKAENGAGNGIAATGIIISSANDTVARFSCDTLGMGLFTMLPVNGLAYHASVNVARKIISAQLPAALHQGLALQIRQTDSLVHAVISSTAKPATDTTKYKYTIVISTQGRHC